MLLSPAVFIVLAVIAFFFIGIYALLASRNLIKAIVGLQITVKGIMLAFVLVGNLRGQIDLGQSLAVTVIVADTIVAVVGLALAVQIRRRFGTLDIGALKTLRR